MQIFNQRRQAGVWQVAGILLGVALAAFVLVGCLSENDEEEEKPAAYGAYGADLALELSQSFPDRSPGSTSERAAGDFIIEELQNLGYEPQVTTFSFQDDAGDRRTSRNIEVHLPGTGFEDEDGRLVRHEILIGAHYDTAIGADLIFPEPDEDEENGDLQEETETPDEPDEPDEPEEPEEEESSSFVLRTFEPDWQIYDGIHDNASGIGVLMTLAKELQDLSLEYDVYLVAFGAGEAAMAGSNHYASQLSQERIDAMDAMYNIDGIYAGDKVYAHAGWNSLSESGGKNYDMRRKLYELTDVFYEYELYTQNRFMLYTNQATYETTLPPQQEEPESDEAAEEPEEEENGEPEPTFLYREWSWHLSDHRPFDDLGIPIVFFDSGDYQVEEPGGARESNNPAFAATEGAIRHTGYDSSQLLQEVFDMTWAASRLDEDEEPQIDRLRQRINNTSFLIVQAALKGRSISPLEAEFEDDDDLGSFFG